jgi:hypothetical protein
MRSGPGEARTILLLHIISVRPSKQPLMVRTFLKVYMELGSYFLFLQEQIKDIIIEINFPALRVMARQYLGVPATSASAERLFSLAGRAFDDLRQCMKEEMLEILMWARINKEKRQRD